MDNWFCIPSSVSEAEDIILRAANLDLPQRPKIKAFMAASHRKRKALWPQFGAIGVFNGQITTMLPNSNAWNLSRQVTMNELRERFRFTFWYSPSSYAFFDQTSIEAMQELADILGIPIKSMTADEALLVVAREAIRTIVFDKKMLDMQQHLLQEHLGHQPPANPEEEALKVKH